MIPTCLITKSSNSNLIVSHCLRISFVVSGAIFVDLVQRLRKIY